MGPGVTLLNPAAATRSDMFCVFPEEKKTNVLSILKFSCLARDMLLQVAANKPLILEVRSRPSTEVQ